MLQEIFPIQIRRRQRQKFEIFVDYKIQNKTFPKISTLDANETEHFNFFEDCIIGITFCYSALECFANITIPDSYTYTYKDKKYFLGIKFFKYHVSKFMHRDDRLLDLSTKLCIILPEIFEVDSPKGNFLWEQFVKLKKLRNDIIHFKKVNLKREEKDIFDESIYKQFFLGEFTSFYDSTVELMRHYYKNKTKADWLD
jgi:hypothetical protein